MYKVGDVVRSQNLGGYFARCIAAGTSGDVEPIWAKDNTTSDASCKWAVYMPALADDLKPYATKQDVADAIKSALLAAFPVGTIIESMNNVNPSTYLGGTWEKMPAGYVTISAGTYTETQDGQAVTYDFEAGNTYGEAAHKLTVGEMPNHSHTYIDAPHLFSERDTSRDDIICPTGNGDAANSMEYSSSNAGGNAYHNNLQPSFTVYRFKRTS